MNRDVIFMHFDIPFDEDEPDPDESKDAYPWSCADLPKRSPSEWAVRWVEGDRGIRSPKEQAAIAYIYAMRYLAW